MLTLVAAVEAYDRAREICDLVSVWLVVFVWVGEWRSR